MNVFFLSLRCSLGTISLTDVGFIVVWTAIFIIYIGAQLVRRPWKGGSPLRLLRTK